MKIKAKDIQSGDRIKGIKAPAYSVRTTTVVTDVNGFTSTYAPDIEVEVERPEPTITITIPRSSAERMADVSYGPSKISVISEACRKALYPAPEPAPRPVGLRFKTGDRVVRTDNVDDGVFKLTHIKHMTARGVAVWYCERETNGRVTWMPEDVFTLASEKPVLRVGAKVRRTGEFDHDYGRSGVGTVVEVTPSGKAAWVTGPNGHVAMWASSLFEVVG